MGHYKAGAKKFQAWVNMWSKPPPSFSNNGTVVLEILVFFCWSILTYSTRALFNIRGYLVSLGNWFIITNLRIVKLHSFIHNSFGCWNYIQFNLCWNLKIKITKKCNLVSKLQQTQYKASPVERLNIDQQKKTNISESIAPCGLKLGVRFEHMYIKIWEFWAPAV